MRIRQTAHIGHVVDVLRSWDSESVHCVVTSPPYYGLRDYGLDPVVWEPVRYAPMSGMPTVVLPDGADPEAFPRCEHDWGAWEERHAVRESVVAGKTRTTDRFYGDDPGRRFDGNHQKHSHGQFCRKCGAWRGCLGLEPTPELYIGHLVQVFREVRRVLRDDGTLWLNLGDSYSNGKRRTRDRDAKLDARGMAVRPEDGRKPKDLLGIPWMAAFALQADGWTLRSDIVWAKLNPLPESVQDRPTRSHEFVFLFSKRERYFYDTVAVQEPAVTQPQRRLTQRHSERDAQMRADKVYPYRLSDEPIQQQAMRNKRDVWTISTKPYKGAHFAVMPPDLVETCVRAGTSEAGVCPHCGAPWKRRVERVVSDAPGSYNGSSFTRGKTHAARAALADVGSAPRADRVQTVGWEPTCACPEHHPIPAVVMDPFGGSGTVAMVAESLDREWALVEANPEYAKLIRKRLSIAVARPRWFLET